MSVLCWMRGRHEAGTPPIAAPSRHPFWHLPYHPFHPLLSGGAREMRELAVRGIDGPGLFIMDVLPDSWDLVEGESS